MHKHLLALGLTGLLASFPATGFADEAMKKDAPAASAPSAPRKFVSEHRLQGKADGQTIDLAYTVTAEDVYTHDHDGKPTATFFTLSYTAKGSGKAEPRPVTFIYNGGPGSSSIWLHFGLVGPKLIDAPSDATSPGAAPFRLKDNLYTLLRVSDLVFVDPVGTGFSKALGEKKNEDFWGYDEDAQSVAEFIRTYITTHNRWNSPKYLLGESYGGIRSALLVQQLQQNLDISLNGVILVSPALDLGTLPFIPTDLSYVTHLPALAATSYYHRKTVGNWPSLRAFLDEVEAFAGSEYLTALFQGDKLPAAERERVAEKLHRYTGVSKEYILRSNLRVYAIRYTKELLRAEGKSVGLLDGRYVQDELDDVAEFPNGDAFDGKTAGIYTALFQHYLRNDLGVDIDSRFIGSSQEANQSWKRPRNGNHAFAGFVDVTGALAQGTKDNEALRIFTAAGYHDLTTSYFATEYMLEHSGIDPAKMVTKLYEGGHMMYLYEPALEALSKDLLAWFAGR